MTTELHWLAQTAERLASVRAQLHGASDRPSLIRAACLDRVVTDMRSRMAAAVPPPHLTVTSAVDATRPPRSKRDQHLASAEVCRRLNEPAAAAAFERLAAACAEERAPPAAPPPLPPAPFSIGPQLELFA